MYIRIHIYEVHAIELLMSTAMKKICFPFFKTFFLSTLEFSKDFIIIARVTC